VYCEHVPPQVLAVRLSRPSRAWEHVAALLRARLETVDLGPGVCGLRLMASLTTRWQPAQQELFEWRDPDGDAAVGVLLDQCIARLGEAAVVRPRLVDDHQPELAFRYEPVTSTPLGAGRGPPAAARSASTARSPRVKSAGRIAPEALPAESGRPTEPRPTRLLARPVLVRAMALVPDGPPTWFALAGREHVIVQAWGPERVETGWWRGPDVRRDYFRVATENGEQYWLFRALDGSGWFLHGIFA
jgi:protein ImuB